jgi:hypothetical protein
MAVILSATFLFIFNARAEEPLVINEISWMGNFKSHSNEWIELYNPKEYEVSLDGWTLRAEDGSPNISLEGIIKEKGFYLLERTNDKSVPNIKADIFYKGALGNEGEHLKLYDNSGKSVDEINCSSGWFKGNNETKKTMERINHQFSGNLIENWQDGPKEGSPKNKNIHIEKEEKIEVEKIENKNPKKTTTLPYLRIPALIIAFFSGLIILTLKKKVKKMYND